MMHEKMRKQLKDMIDHLDEHKLRKYYKQLLSELTLIETEELTEEKKREIQQILDEYKNGEYYTFEDVFGEGE